MSWRSGGGGVDFQAPLVLAPSEVALTYPLKFAMLPLDCRPAAGAVGKHNFTLSLTGSGGHIIKITVRVRESVFYLKKVREEGLTEANSKHGTAFRFDNQGGLSVGWRAFADVSTAWQFVKDSV